MVFCSKMTPDIQSSHAPRTRSGHRSPVTMFPYVSAGKYTFCIGLAGTGNSHDIITFNLEVLRHIQTLMQNFGILYYPIKFKNCTLVSGNVQYFFLYQTMQYCAGNRASQSQTAPTNNWFIPHGMNCHVLTAICLRYFCSVKKPGSYLHDGSSLAN